MHEATPYELLILVAQVLGFASLVVWVLLGRRQGEGSARGRVFACAGATATCALVALAFSLHPGWDVLPPPRRFLGPDLARELGPECVAALAVLPTIACGWVTREFDRIRKSGDFRSLVQMIGLDE